MGSGRIMGHWTGDNQATWDDIKYSIAGVVNTNMFGISFTGLLFQWTSGTHGFCFLFTNRWKFQAVLNTKGLNFSLLSVVNVNLEILAITI